MATLLDLKNRVLSYLRRMPGDASVPSDRLEDAINRARLDEWKRVGGPVPDTATMNIVAGRRDYPVSGPVHAVNYKSSSTAQATRLTRQTPSEILRNYTDLTDTSVTSGTPTYWTMRPKGDPTAVESVVYNALVAESTLPTGVMSISLYPEPSASVTDGLIIESEGPATALVDDDDVSELPDAVDTAACWKAALELIAFIGHEPEALALAQFIDGMGRKAEARSFEEVMSLLAVWDSIGPAAYIGVDYESGVLKGEGGYDVVRAMEKATYTLTTDDSSVSVPCTVTPDPSGTIIAFSKEQGQVTSVVANGSVIDVTADGGMTFYSGDVITVLYEGMT